MIAMTVAFPVEAVRPVSRDEDRPAYTQIATQLREIIRSDDLGPGTPLPSQTVLADRFGVSIMTLREGLRILRDAGTLRIDQGIGIFVGSAPGKSPRGTAEGHPNAKISSFVSDLQEHIETVTTFYIPQNELTAVLQRMADEGHREIPTT